MHAQDLTDRKHVKTEYRADKASPVYDCTPNGVAEDKVQCRRRYYESSIIMFQIIKCSRVRNGHMIFQLVPAAHLKKHNVYFFQHVK